jgi:site-specific recombinase XerD
MATHAKRSKRIVTNPESIKLINEHNQKIMSRYKTEQKMKGLSEKSIYNYEKDLLHFLAWNVEENFNSNIEDIDEDDIKQFISYCMDQGNNVERIKRRMSSISTLYIYLKRARKITENPMEFIPRPKKGLPVVNHIFLSKEQVDKIVEFLEKNEKIQLLTYFLISVHTMGRVNAVRTLTFNQINWEEMVFEDVLEKEGYIVTLYANEIVMGAIKRLIKYREENGIDDDGNIFITSHGNVPEASTCNSWSKQIGEIVNEPDLHPHCFRKTGAQLLNLNGCPLEVISSLLHHKSLEVTKNHYLLEDKSKIREQLNKYKF